MSVCWMTLDVMLDVDVDVHRLVQEDSYSLWTQVVRLRPCLPYFPKQCGHTEGFLR